MKLFHGSKESNLQYKDNDICNIYNGSLIVSNPLYLMVVMFIHLKLMKKTF